MCVCVCSVGLFVCVYVRVRLRVCMCVCLYVCMRLLLAGSVPEEEAERGFRVCHLMQAS